jgi:NADH:ubiquinone oxidoreductase subunit
MTVLNAIFNLLKSIFTWWNGATIGASLQISKGSRFVGEDEFGNKYYETVNRKYDLDGRNRRYVVYKGYAEPTKVPPDWHGWLHHAFAEPPTREPLKRKAWEKDFEPNMTGTVWAWRSQGTIAAGGERPKAAGDYEAWSPE